MMNKIALLLLLFISPIFLAAQDKENLFRTTVYLDASVGFYNWKSFKSFSNQYNKSNKETLKNDLGNCGLWTGYKGGFSFMVGRLFTAVEIYRLNSSTNAKFTNDLQRKFAASINGVEPQIGWNSKAEKIRPYISIGFGAIFTHLKGSLKYANGETSYGGESYLNGAWSNTEFCSSLNAGVQFIIKNHVLLHVSGQYRYMPNGSELGSNPYGRNDSTIPDGTGTFLSSGTSGITASLGLGYKF